MSQMFAAVSMIAAYMAAGWPVVHGSWPARTFGNYGNSAARAGFAMICIHDHGGQWHMPWPV